jgi:hypothetical protein
MRKFLFIYFFASLFFACKTSKDFVSVQNLKSIQTYYPNNVVYNLPKTQIIICVEVSKINNSKGPYSEYTEKYLGILNNVIQKNESFWEICNVTFYSIPIIDTLNSYVISSKSNESIIPFSFTKEGFPVAYNSNDVVYEIPELKINNSAINSQSAEAFSFNVLASDKPYKTIYDTTYREQVVDTVIVKVPVLKPNLVRKTNEEQAKELADRIITLRDDKAALIVGEADNENLPNGDALNIMLEQIDLLQKEFLTAFIGKSDTIKYSFYFTYTPGENDFDTQIPIFKFSPQSGILPFENFIGSTVYLDIKAEKIFSDNLRLYNSQSESYYQSKKNSNSAFYYRIPQKSKISLTINSQTISEKTIFISQLGSINYLPVEIFRNPDLKIIFNPELGSIKSIEN